MPNKQPIAVRQGCYGHLYQYRTGHPIGAAGHYLRTTSHSERDWGTDITWPRSPVGHLFAFILARNQPMRVEPLSINFSLFLWSMDVWCMLIAGLLVHVSGTESSTIPYETFLYQLHEDYFTVMPTGPPWTLTLENITDIAQTVPLLSKNKWNVHKHAFCRTGLKSTLLS